ncbi:Fe-S cluster assembly protein SufD, partial [Staphylococcus aureus]|nr:Fe-S cluster assembly protein SufD [Staphylococcus aureus]
MPTGREEIWRFTPIKTFIPVLSEVALEPRQEAGIIDVDVKRADGITVTDLATSELKKLAETPQDRLSALAAADPPAVNRRVVIPPATSLKAPVGVT